MMDQSKVYRSSKFTDYVHNQISMQKDNVQSDLSAQFQRLKKIKREHTLMALQQENNI